MGGHRVKIELLHLRNRGVEQQFRHLGAERQRCLISRRLRESGQLRQQVIPTLQIVLYAVQGGNLGQQFIGPGIGARAGNHRAVQALPVVQKLLAFIRVGLFSQEFFYPIQEEAFQYIPELAGQGDNALPGGVPEEVAHHGKSGSQNLHGNGAGQGHEHGENAPSFIFHRYRSFRCKNIGLA